jgi:phage tail-like protein
MAELSSYIKYLPSVLSEQESDPKQFLGQVLRIFEKILTGIADGVQIGTADRSYAPIEQLIDELPQLYSTWQTPAAYLPWLASWVALTLRPTWSEYQQRRAIGNISSIYHLRGLRQGLHAYLDIYTLTQARPRIAIDDGSAILRLRFTEDGQGELRVVAHSHNVALPAVPAVPPAPTRPASNTPILIHPSAVAVDSHNDYFVVDQGIREDSDIDVLRRPALWKVSSTGEIRYAAGVPMPMPQPIQSDVFFRTATAVVVDSQDRCSVIAIGKPTQAESQNSALRRFAPPDFAASGVISQSTSPKLPAVCPVDMVLDSAGNFVILDRGTHPVGDPPSGFVAKPKIVVVSENPLAVATHPLAAVVEPTALLFEPDRTFIVADARNQFAADVNDPSIWEPADLLRINPANNWSAVSLLQSVPAGLNPLIFPTGMALEAPNVVLVCDTGLRWGYGEDQSNRTMAEPAAVYRIDLRQSPPVITRVSDDRVLVSPTKLVIDRAGAPIITDRGESLGRSWRVRPHEFGVIVHFSRQRPTDNDERNLTRRGIASVVEEQKPAHTTGWMKSA